MYNLKQKFLNEIDPDLYEADGADFVAERCVEIAREYASSLQSDREKQLEEKIMSLEKMLDDSEAFARRIGKELRELKRDLNN